MIDADYSIYAVEERLATSKSDQPVQPIVVFVLFFHRLQNKHNQALNLCLGSVRWMAARVDFLSALFIGVVALSTILMSEDAGKHRSFGIFLPFL